MRCAWLIAMQVVMVALPCRAYDVNGSIDPAASVTVFLHGATIPFENSTLSDSDGHFHLAKVPAGTYTVATARLCICRYRIAPRKNTKRRSAASHAAIARARPLIWSAVTVAPRFTAAWNQLAGAEEALRRFLK
jgi:hypothetical protein